MTNHNIVLRISWLRKHNPQINWKQEIFTIECECMLNSKPRHQLNIIKDERISWKSQPKKIIIFNLNLRHQKHGSTTIDTDQCLSDQEISSQENHISPDIFHKY